MTKTQNSLLLTKKKWSFQGRKTTVNTKRKKKSQSLIIILFSSKAIVIYEDDVHLSLHYENCTLSPGISNIK